MPNVSKRLIDFLYNDAYPRPCHWPLPNVEEPLREVVLSCRAKSRGVKDTVWEYKGREFIERTLAAHTDEELAQLEAAYDRFRETARREAEELVARRVAEDAAKREREQKEREEREAKRLAEEAERKRKAEEAEARRAEQEHKDAVAAEIKRQEAKAEAAAILEAARTQTFLGRVRDQLRPVPAAAFFAADDGGHEWLVEGLIVAGEPLLVGGPKKTLKTSIAVDLALSLASGVPFLGRFAVPKPRSVLLFSGESGPATLRETARRVAAARGVRVEDVPVAWQTGLPNLSDLSHVEALKAEAAPFDVVIIDPFYRCLARDTNPANLFAVGDVLGRAAQALAGKTFILLHHATKDTWERKPLDLSDLAFAGVQEFARQWVLVNRRKKFEPGRAVDLHKLVVTYGGSAGHTGWFALDVDEGKLRSDFTGRQWLVTVRGYDEAKEADKAAQRGGDAAKKADKVDTAVAALVAALPDDGSSKSYSSVRRHLHRNPTDMDAAIAAAVERGLIREERSDTGRRRLARIIEPASHGEPAAPKGEAEGGCCSRPIERNETSNVCM